MDSSNTETGSSPFKGLIEQVPKSPLFEGEESKINSPLIPLVSNRGEQLGRSGLSLFETLLA